MRAIPAPRRGGGGGKKIRKGGAGKRGKPGTAARRAAKASGRNIGHGGGRIRRRISSSPSPLRSSLPRSSLPSAPLLKSGAAEIRPASPPHFIGPHGLPELRVQVETPSGLRLDRRTIPFARPASLRSSGFLPSALHRAAPRRLPRTLSPPPLRSSPSRSSLPSAPLLKSGAAEIRPAARPPSHQLLRPK